MSHRSLPPSRLAPPPLSSGVLRMMHRPTPVLVSPVLLDDAEAPAVRPRTPYAVERLPAAAGWVRLVGYDARGLYATEVTMPARRYTEQTPSKLRRWLMLADADPSGTPTLSLID